MRKGKPNLSDRLYKLIYNPELPLNWKALPDNDKVVMFFHLFLLINEEFQKKFGKELATWVSIYSDLHEGNSINHPWMPYKHGVYINKKCTDCTKNGKHKCKMNVSQADLYDTLIRIPKGEHVTFDNKQLFRMYKKSVRHPYEETTIYLGSQDISTTSESQHFAIKDFSTYLESIYNGSTPRDLYPQVKIFYSKEKLMKDFEDFIDEQQTLYFKNHPEDKIIEYGHFEKKSDNRKKNYPFYEWERYLKLHILKNMGKKPAELAKQFFNTYNVSTNRQVNTYNKKAINLSRNAMKGDFPGKYS